MIIKTLSNRSYTFWVYIVDCRTTNYTTIGIYNNANSIMQTLLIKLLLMWIAVYGATVLVPGVEVSGFWIAVVVAWLLAVANMTIGRILRIISLPINILSLWLVGFLISILIIGIVDSLVAGFSAWGFFNMALFAIVLGLIQMAFRAYASRK